MHTLLCACISVADFAPKRPEVSTEAVLRSTQLARRLRDFEEVLKCCLQYSSDVIASPEYDYCRCFDCDRVIGPHSMLLRHEKEIISLPALAIRYRVRICCEVDRMLENARWKKDCLAFRLKGLQVCCELPDSCCLHPPGFVVSRESQ